MSAQRFLVVSLALVASLSAQAKEAQPQQAEAPTPAGAGANAAEAIPPELLAQIEQAAKEQEAFMKAVGYKPGPFVGEMGASQIQVPEGYLFADGAGAKKWAELTTNPVSNKEVGLIANEEQGWLVMFKFDEVGYVKDDEKDDLDAEDLLASIKEGTEAFNATRRAAGAPDLHIVGWEQKPVYNEAEHALEWCVRMESGGEPNLNFNTRVLGRKGVMTVTLMFGGETALADVLPHFRTLMKGFSFKPGDTYSEYRDGDKLAEYGLAALVAGGAVAGAAKLGLFGKLAAILAKSAKLVIVAVVGVVAGAVQLFKKIFGKNDSE